MPRGNKRSKALVFVCVVGNKGPNVRDIVSGTIQLITYSEIAAKRWLTSVGSLALQRWYIKIEGEYDYGLGSLVDYTPIQSVANVRYAEDGVAFTPWDVASKDSEDEDPP